MTREQAIEHLTFHPSDKVEYRHRDATLSHWITVRCWLDTDGDLVQRHPTDFARSPISAPSDVQYTVVPESLLQSERQRVEAEHAY